MSALRDTAAQVVAAVKTANLVRELQLSDEEGRPKSPTERAHLRAEKQRRAVELVNLMDTLMLQVHALEPVLQALEEYRDELRRYGPGLGSQSTLSRLLERIRDAAVAPSAPGRRG